LIPDGYSQQRGATDLGRTAAVSAIDEQLRLMSYSLDPLEEQVQSKNSISVESFSDKVDRTVMNKWSKDRRITMQG
jgi:hypothetical protein